MPAAAHADPTALAHPSLGEVIETEQRVRRRRFAVRIVLGILALAAGIAVTAVVWPRPLTLSDSYRTQAIEQGPIVRTVSATGRVEPRASVDVGAQVSGRIESVAVDFNDPVRRGQVLARFDTESLKAQAVQAKASVAAARATLRRAKVDLADVRRRLARSRRLNQAGIEPDEQVEVLESAAALAEASVDQARAQVALQDANAQLARTNLGYAEILAPIDGIVISRNVEVGQTVVTAFQTPVLFVIAEDLQKMRVIAAIDEADIGEVKPGQAASFTVDAFPGQRFTAALAELRSAAHIAQNVVTYEAVLDVDNPDLMLRPGMTASIEIETAAVAEVMQVPNAALRFTPPDQEEPNEHTVWVIRDDALVPIHVVPGVTDGTVTEVTGDDPFLPDDAVVVDLTPAGRAALEGRDE